MSIEQAVKQFIEENIDLVDDNEFLYLYKQIKSYTFTRSFTETLLAASINPLDYMTEIPERYLYESKIQTLHIPAGITTVGKYAFARCTELTQVSLPEGVTLIDEGAFMNCTKLERVQLPATLRYIETGAFQGCTALKDVTFSGTSDQWLKVVDYGSGLIDLEPITCLGG